MYKCIHRFKDIHQQKEKGRGTVGERESERERNVKRYKKIEKLLI